MKKKLPEIRHPLDDHYFDVTSFDCEYGDHVSVTCHCGWIGTDSIDDRGQYMQHLKEVLSARGIPE